MCSMGHRRFLFESAAELDSNRDSNRDHSSRRASTKLSALSDLGMSTEYRIDQLMASIWKSETRLSNSITGPFLRWRETRPLARWYSTLAPNVCVAGSACAIAASQSRVPTLLYGVDAPVTVVLVPVASFFVQARAQKLMRS